MSAPSDQWWVINAADLRAALQRAHDDDPEFAFIELYANTSEEHE